MNETMKGIDRYKVAAKAELLAKVFKQNNWTWGGGYGSKVEAHVPGAAEIALSIMATLDMLQSKPESDTISCGRICVTRMHEDDGGFDVSLDLGDIGIECP